MRRARVLLLVGLLAAPVLLSGCLTSVQATKDWWSGDGNLVIRMGTLPADAPGQRMRDFSTLKIAVASMVAYPTDRGTLGNAHAGVTWNPPFGIDLRTRYDEQESLIVLERYGIPTKPIGTVNAQIIYVEGKDAAGNPIPPCPQEGPSEKKPCMAWPKGGFFVLDKSADPQLMQRAKTMTMEFPLAVIYDPEDQEYFLQARSAASEAPVTFS